MDYDNDEAQMSAAQQQEQAEQEERNEFEGYDQENLEMFQQQDQHFYAEDLRQQEQNNSKMRYF